jgi:deoxyribonuclease V
MNVRQLHDWPCDSHAAVALQEQLRDRLVVQPIPRGVRVVAGADVSYDKGSDRVFAGVVVMRLPGLDVIEEGVAEAAAPFPYVPGLLSFRELPAVIDVFRQIEMPLDAALFDAQGIAHMRGIGLAAHAGLWLGIPTVGCAKSRLVGGHREPRPERGRRAPLRYGGRVVGSVVRTRSGVKPIYVSPGHLADVRTSVRLVLRCAGGYRQPEPTRAAHVLVNKARRGKWPGTR